LTDAHGESFEADRDAASVVAIERGEPPTVGSNIENVVANEPTAVAEKPIMNMRATVTLIAINVAIYVFVNGLSDTPRLPDVLDAGAMYGPAVVHGEYWRIVTSAFLHANFLHIATNMLALLQVGSLVETMLGKRRMLAAYAFSMMTSAAAQLVFTFNQPSIGASGAIFGLFGTLVAIGLTTGRGGRMLVRQVLPIIAINLAIGFVVPAISSTAHIGGLIGGFVIGFVLLKIGKLKAVPAPVPPRAPQTPRSAS
jgi:rhomboid protease GluP